MAASDTLKTEFHKLVHATAKMLAWRCYHRTRPEGVTEGEYVRARWPEFTSQSLDFLALKAAELEARKEKRGLPAPPRFTP